MQTQYKIETENMKSTPVMCKKKNLSEKQLWYK